jgi:hypothetical protein
MNTPRKNFTLLILLLVLWQLLMSLQGLDLADTGFHMSAFRFIIDDPYSVQYSMSFYLSEILGYTWMQLLPEGGLFWCRIGGILFFTATYLLYNRILTKETGNDRVIPGLLIISLFILKGGFECLNYDLFTMSGYALVIYLLFTGLKTSRGWLLFLGGMTIGISMFFKLTNLTAVLFLLLVPFYLYLEDSGIRKHLRYALFSAAGLVAGISVILVLIRILGHWTFFFDNLAFLFEIASDDQASHGILTLLSSYATGLANAAVMLAVFLAVFLAGAWFSGRFPRLKMSVPGRRNSFLVYAIAVFSTILLMILFGNAFWSKVRYLLIGLVVLSGIQYVLDKSRSNTYRLLSAAGFILFLTASLGSDSWIGKSLHGMWILVPLVLADQQITRIFLPLKLKLSASRGRMVRSTLGLVILVSAILYAWQNTYFDAGSRLVKRYNVQHEKLALIYTSEERARVIDDLITEAFPQLSGEYLLSFMDIPMVNYLADKRPFISTSWPKLYYHPDTFAAKLEEAVNKRGCLPDIIRQKQNTGVVPWPAGQPEPGYLSYPAHLFKWPGHGAILNRFIDSHGYRVLWENEMFQLLVTDQQASSTGEG